MNRLQVFRNNQLGEVRTTLIDGEPWFVDKDICTIFGDTNHNRTLGRIDEEDKRIVKFDTSGGKQNTIIINESGFYSLLFNMQPQKANNNGVANAYPPKVEQRLLKLKEFKRWVTSEVLPSIRKYGMYAKDELTDDPEVFLAKSVEYLYNKNIRLESQVEQQATQLQSPKIKIAENQHKVLFANGVATSENTILIGQLATLITQAGYHIGQNKLFAWLRDNGYLVKQKGLKWNHPTQRSINQGLMQVDEFVRVLDNQQTKTEYTPKITGKGQLYFVDKFRRMLLSKEKMA